MTITPKLFRGSRLILIVFVLAIIAGAVPAWSSSYFLYSQWGGTWYDTNKTGVDDSLMCWAASASNILEWGNWDTAVYNTAPAIFQNIKSHWTNNRGWQSWAWQWWLNGIQPPNKIYSHIDVAGGGNYFPTADFYSYYDGETTNLLPTIDQMMQNGYGVSLVIVRGAVSHAITMWGFDYTLVDGVKNYTSIYATDSDDGVTALKNFALTYNNGWYLGTGYTGWQIIGAYGLEMNDGNFAAANNFFGNMPPTSPVPLAPTWILVGPVILLLIVQTRRRYAASS